MSRAKEVQVLVFDVNPSMGKNLKSAKEALLMHVQQKMIQTPKTEIGLLCVGDSCAFSCAMSAARPCALAQVFSVRRSEYDKLPSWVCGVRSVS